MAAPWIAPALAALCAALAPSGDGALPEGALVRLGSWTLRHRDPVTALDFGAEGVLSGGLEGGLRLWSADGASLKAGWDGEAGVAVTGALLLAEERAAFLASDGRLGLWSFAEPGRAPESQSLDLGSRFSIAPGGQVACLTGRDERARLVALEGGAVLHELEADGLLPDASAFAPDGARVAIAFENRNKLLRRRGTETQPSGILLIVKTESGEVERKIESATRSLHAVAFTPDGTEVVAADDQGGVRVWRASDGELRLAAPPAAPSAARGLAVAADGSFAAVARDDGSVALVGLAAGEERGRATVSHSAVSRVALAPGGDALIAAAGYELFLFGLPELKPLASRFRHAGPIAAVAWSQDGERLVTGSYDRTLRAWGAKDGAGVFATDANAGFVFAVAAGKDFFAAGGQDGHVRLFQADSKLRADIAAHDAACTDLALAPGGKVLASVGADRVLRLSDASTGESLHVLRDLPGLQFRLAWSPDGSRVAVGSSDVRLVDAATGELVETLPRLAAPLTALAFSPDGSTLAAGLADRSITLLDLAGAPPQFLHGHAGRITAVAFAPDGKTLASASSSETLVRLWSWRERKELKRLAGFEREVLCLAYDAAGKRLAAGSMDGMGLVFAAD
jgi:WD40 repeat protein